MAENGNDGGQSQGQLAELAQQVVAMGNMVESLFADSVVGLIERRRDTAQPLRMEDCRAHELRIRIDRRCMELLTQAGLDAGRVRFVMACTHIATNLKHAADESVGIAQLAQDCDLNSLPDDTGMDALPRMADLTQSMLSDCIEAFINRDAAEASSLHAVFRKVASLRDGVQADAERSITDGLLPVAVGCRLVGIGQRIARIGDEVLDIANQVSHSCCA